MRPRRSFGILAEQPRRELVQNIPPIDSGSLVNGESALSGEIILAASEHQRSLIDAIGNREGAPTEAIARERSRLARRTTLGRSMPHAGPSPFDLS